MRTVYQSLLIIAACIAFCFCSCTSADYTPNKLKARVYEVRQSSYDYKYRNVNDVVLIRYVDSLNKAGDIIELAGTRYVIDSIEGGNHE